MPQLEDLKLDKFAFKQQKGLFTFYLETQNYQKSIKEKSSTLKQSQKIKLKQQNQAQSNFTRKRTLTQPKKEQKKEQKNQNKQLVQFSSPRCAILNFSPKLNTYQQAQLCNLKVRPQIIGSSINPLIKQERLLSDFQSKSFISSRKKLKTIEDQIILQKDKKQKARVKQTKAQSQIIFIKRKEKNIKSTQSYRQKIKSSQKQQLINSLWPQNQNDLISKINKKVLNFQSNQRKKELIRHRRNDIRLNNPLLCLNQKKSIKEIIKEYKIKYQTSLNSNLLEKIKTQQKKQHQDNSYIWKKQHKKQQIFYHKQMNKLEKDSPKNLKSHYSSIQINKQHKIVENILQRYRIKSNKCKKSKVDSNSFRQFDFLYNNNQ